MDTHGDGDVRRLPDTKVGQQRTHPRKLVEHKGIVLAKDVIVDDDRSELPARQPADSHPPGTAENALLSWRWSDRTAGDVAAQTALREVRDAVFDPARVLAALVRGVDDDRG
jgi:hypothetical protein